MEPATDQPAARPPPGANLTGKRCRAASGINCKRRKYDLLATPCHNPHLPTVAAAFNRKKPSGHQQHGAARNRRMSQPCIKPCPIETPTMAVWMAQKFSFRWSYSSPDRTVAIARHVTLRDEFIDQPHINQQPPRSRR